jgi:hypothetical protein
LDTGQCNKNDQKATKIFLKQFVLQLPYIILLFVETPRKFITAETIVLYVLSPCKPTKNLAPM